MSSTARPGASFERWLGDTIKDLRPVERTPADLAGRIAAIPVLRPHVHPVVRLLSDSLVPLAAAAVGVAAIAIAAVGLERAPLVGLPPGSAPAPGFDPSIEGAGLITGVFKSMAILTTGLAIVAGIIALRELSSARIATNRGRAIALVAAFVAALASGIVRIDGYAWLDHGSSGSVLLGAGLQATEVPFHEGHLYYITAQPGEPIVTMFTLRNDSSLPVRVEGIVVPERYDWPTAHWTGVWLPGGRSALEGTDLENVRPFEPTTISPGDELELYLAGRAGRCAYGPTFDPATLESDPQVGGMSSLGPDVEVAFSVFGLTSTVVIQTFYTFAEPSRNDCTPTQALGTRK